jgi:hypothetical protein
MKSFPKKYKPQDLNNRAKYYKELKKDNSNNYIFSTEDIPINKKITYQDFFIFYLKDFLNYIDNKNNKDYTFQQLFIASNNQLQNVCSGYDFFNKKNQSINQV